MQGRVARPEHDRVPFYLYVDELDNFTDDGQTFNTILSEARKYKLGCWLAAQFLNQLGDTDLRRAVANNCRTKIFFNSSGSEDTHFISEMLTGLDRERVTSLSKFQAAVKQPATDGTPRDAVVFETYLPWDTDRDRLSARIEELVAQYDTVTEQRPQVQARKGGAGDNTGGERHAALLNAAFQYFQVDRGHRVTILDQQPGDDRPDAHIQMDGQRVNLEAERSTLSRPGKVLRNVQRAAEQDRPLLFVVEQGDAPKLANILTDPVNRRGDDHSDDRGTFDYYSVDGEPFTAVDVVDDVAWSIYVARPDEETLVEYDPDTPMECPELDVTPESELEKHCLYRDASGYCDQLEAPCPIID